MRYGDSVSLSRIRNPRQTPVQIITKKISPSESFVVFFYLFVFEMFCDYFRIEIPGKSARWFETISKHGPSRRFGTISSDWTFFKLRKWGIFVVCTCIWSSKKIVCLCPIISTYILTQEKIHSNELTWV